MKWLKKFRKENKEFTQEAKDIAKELSTTMAANNLQYVQENRNKLFDVIAKYHKGELTKETIKPTLKAGFILLNCVTKEEQEEILRTCLEVDLDIKKDSDFTNDEFDIYREIIKYIHENRQKEVKILLKKAAQKIHNRELAISRRTIDFVVGISDEELKILKEIFRYVVGNGIILHKQIERDFIKNGLNKSKSSDIKFLGTVFSDQYFPTKYKHLTIKIEAVRIEGIRIWKCYISNFKQGEKVFDEDSLRTFLKNEENKNEFNQCLDSSKPKIEIISDRKIKFFITKQPDQKQLPDSDCTIVVEINIPLFVALDEIGSELYSLLKDEIGGYHDEYLQAIKEEEQYKDFGLEYEIVA